MRWNFRFFYINRFATGPLHYCCSLFDLDSEYRTRDYFAQRELKRSNGQVVYLFPTLKGVWHEIFDFWFFHESVSPRPLSIQRGDSTKICGSTVFTTLFLSPVSMTPGIKSSRVNNTGDKVLLLTASNYCRCRDYALSWIFIDFMTTAINSLPVTMMSSNNLLPVSTTPAIKLLDECQSATTLEIFLIYCRWGWPSN